MAGMIEPTIVLGAGALLMLLLFGLIAAVLFVALLVWLIPFALIIGGIYFLSKNRQTAGFVAVAAGLLILLFYQVGK